MNNAPTDYQIFGHHIVVSAKTQACRSMHDWLFNAMHKHFTNLIKAVSTTKYKQVSHIYTTRKDTQYAHCTNRQTVEELYTDEIHFLAVLVYLPDDQVT